MSQEIVLVGLSHHTAPVEVREQVAFANGRLEHALRGLVAHPAIKEGVIVSTCNRVEVVACGSTADEVAAAIPGFLAAEHGVAAETLSARLYTYRGREAVRHLFRVAASLDSMVVGEPQILGQLKDQYALAAAIGASGRVLHRCFHKSFSVAKRVRSETGIAARAVSVGSTAVQLAKEIFDRFQDKTALLIGAGTMGELTARQLLGQGTGTLMVSNRTFDRASDVARELGGIAVPFEKVRRTLPLADLVIGAAGGETHVLGRSDVEEAMRERRGRPMLLIDLAVPRSFDPTINELDGVYLYDIDDLEGVIADNKGARAQEATLAEQIVEAEVDGFCRWLEGLDVVPTVVALREKIEQIRQRELERYLAALGTSLDPRQREAVERLTRAIVNKILHAPLTELRRRDSERDEALYVDVARMLFRLGGGPDPDEDP
ncbi:MAG: glutamyl-tRNA reductase [Candidatus Binatia bacterium]